MSLTRKNVESIAHLARLAITEEEATAYADSLSKILHLVDQLNVANVAEIDPMAHPLSGMVQRLRADEVTASDEHEKFQRNATKVASGLYLVPKVIE